MAVREIPLLDIITDYSYVYIYLLADNLSIDDELTDKLHDMLTGDSLVR